MSDPMAMAQAVMAIQRQAVEEIRACKDALAAAGRTFSPELEAEIATQAAAHTGPETEPSPELIAQSADTAKRAMEAVYPENGFAPDDPRIAPIEGVSMPLYAIACKAIGWSTDEQFQTRVAGALGIEPDVWQRVGTQIRQRVTEDVVVATYYGQLFVAA